MGIRIDKKGVIHLNNVVIKGEYLGEEKKYNTKIMEKNETLLKFSGKSAIDFPVQIDEDIEIVVKGAIVKSEKLSNQDGTYDLVYTCKILEIQKCG